LQGLKPEFFLGAFCGTTEVMPCYKALFDEVFAAAREFRLLWKFNCDCPVNGSIWFAPVTVVC